MGCWAEGWVVWEDGVQASWVEEFGLVLGSGKLGILEWKVMGAVLGWMGVWAWFWVDSGSGDGLLDVG